MIRKRQQSIRDERIGRASSINGKALSHSRPLMKATTKQKEADDWQWGKDFIDYIVGQSGFGTGSASGSSLSMKSVREALGIDSAGSYSLTDTSKLSRWERLDVLYKVYNLNFEWDWFKKILDPVNAEESHNKTSPADLRPYSLVRPEANYTIQEKTNRPTSYVVVVTNNDVDSMKNEALLKEVRANLIKIKDQITTSSQPQQDPTKVQTPGQQQINEKVMSPQGQEALKSAEELLSAFNLNYKDLRALQVESALETLSYELSLQDFIADLMRDWTVVGEAYYDAWVENNKVYLKYISPYDIAWGADSYEKYVEDADWACVRYIWTPAKVVEHAYQYLTDSQITQLDRIPTNVYYEAFSGFYSTDARARYRRENPTENIEVFHCQWAAFSKKGIVTYIDELGTESQFEVDDTFSVPRGMKSKMFVEWYWVKEVYEGWLVDNEFYIGIRKLPYQRSSVNARSEAKLTINGAQYSKINGRHTSLVELGLPLQMIYIICWIKLEILIAKSQGTIVFVDINTIPSGEGKLGVTPEGFFHKSQTLGFGLLDLNQEGVRAGTAINNAVSTANTSLFADIAEQMKIMEFIVNEWERVAGIPRQAKGQTMASEGLGVTRSAIQQTNKMLDHIIREFEALEEKMYQSLVELSKFAWIDGKTMFTINNEGQVVLNNLDVEKYVNADVNVYVTRSPQANKDINDLKGAALQAASAKGDMLQVAEIIRAKSYASATKALYMLKDKEAQQQQGMEQAKAKAQQEQAQMMAEVERMKAETQMTLAREQHMLELAKMEQEHKYNVEIELIRADATMALNSMQVDLNKDGAPDAYSAALENLETLKVKVDAESKKQKAINDKDKVSLEAAKTVANIELEREKMQHQKEVETLKAKTALKNKVAGEKSTTTKSK